MPCGTCGFANDDAARFCGSCGAALTAACAKCGAQLTDGLRFCTSCGEPTGAVRDAPPDTTSAAEAERRRISVLFVDLENFTSLAETLDPEEVRGVQSRYFEVARAIVASYGGTIEKFIGDAVMAVWGAPTAHEDDAERAVRAALAIIDGVSRLGGAASGGALVARAAVTTGEAAVTLDAPGQGMVAGDLVNVAARLQSSAPSGTLLVDTATREMAPEAAAYESIGTIALKGRTARLPAHRASAAGAAGGSGRGIHGGDFVGRDRELRELVDLFDGVARDRLSRLVSVTGIAGIGKSRLVWEFSERLDARPEDVAWHSGRAPAYGDGITFAAVADMVRRRAGVAADASPELARRQLLVALEELIRDEAERRWIEPRISVLLGASSEQAFDRDELFAAWRRFFERVSDRSPTVLIFEDLQWADPALLDFIEHLATWTRGQPILIIAVARPELLDRRPTWGVGIGRFTTLHLERLSDAAMRELLVGRAPTLPAGLVHTILERAGGVPLYAVEVVRIIEDRDEPHAERRASSRDVADPPQPIDVPDSLHGVIAARIDALPAPERRLLLSAAVLGRHFRPEALVAVSGAESGPTRELTDGLVRRELLTIDGERRSPAFGELRFVQDLVREVAYRTVARSARRSLHLSAARFLETRDDDESAEPLASHLVEAHRLAPEHPDAIRIARRAVAALRRSATAAMRLHVAERALGHLEQALRLVDSNEQRALLLEEASAAARASGRLDVAEAHLRELVFLHTDGGRTTDAARARARLASVLLMAQRNKPALAELESAVSAIGDLGADAPGVEVASQLARARLLMGDDRGGLEWAERALEAAERLGLEGLRTDILATRGTARYQLGDDEGGLSDLRQAIDDAEAAGFLSTELRARNNLAWLVVTDDPRTTLETAREGFELATTMGIGDIAVQLAEVACTAALDVGEWDWALETMARVIDGPMPSANRINLLVITTIIGALTGKSESMRALEAVEPLPSDTDSQVVSGVFHARAWLAFVAGSFEEAQRLAAEAASRVFGGERAHQLTLQARASLWMRDREGAVAALADLGRLKLNGRATEATVATLITGVAALDGAANAAAGYRRAVEVWRSLDLPVHLALCLLDWHRLMGERSDSPEEAMEILRELGADALLRLVSDATGPTVKPRPAASRQARSRQPRAGTARPTGAIRPPRRARGRPSPSD